jgi:hypothetical protein
LVLVAKLMAVLKARSVEVAAQGLRIERQMVLQAHDAIGQPVVTPVKTSIGDAVGLPVLLMQRIDSQRIGSRSAQSGPSTRSKKVFPRGSRT